MQLSTQFQSKLCGYKTFRMSSVKRNTTLSSSLLIHTHIIYKYIMKKKCSTKSTRYFQSLQLFYQELTGSYHPLLPVSTTALSPGKIMQIMPKDIVEQFAVPQVETVAVFFIFLSLLRSLASQLSQPCSFCHFE